MVQRATGRGSLVRVTIYVEGGGSSVASKRLCRQAFTTLIKRCGLHVRRVRFDVKPSGSRSKAFRQFQIARRQAGTNDFIGLLIDSETTVADINRTWDHLRESDGWTKPRGTTDDHVLFMTTSMETWIAADRDALRKTYSRRGLNENALPPLVDLENRSRQDVFNRLRRATGGRYRKGDDSFRVLGTLNPDTLGQHLPSFARARRILRDKLNS